MKPVTEERWFARGRLVVNAVGWVVVLAPSAEDAALIAAAPGLYRALDALMLDVFVGTIVVGRDGAQTIEQGALRDSSLGQLAVAALRRARGEP